MTYRIPWVWQRSFALWLFGFTAWIPCVGGESLLHAAPSVNSLLLQVQQCIQQKRGGQTRAVTQAVMVRCVFSVAMLNPDGTVRPDASDRMAALLKATGTTISRAQSQGQANITLQTLPAQSLFAVPVRIQGQTLPFVLDSGASNTILDTQVAQRLGLSGQVIPSELLGYLAVGQQFADQKMSLYRLPPLQMGRAQVSQLYGIGLSTAVLPFKTAGILGLDFLSRFDMILNPQNHTLRLLQPSLPLSSGVTLEGRLGVMTAPSVFVNGKGPYRFLVDTGASVTSLSEQLAQQISLKTQPATNLRVSGIGGQTLAKQGQIARLNLQTQQISKLNVLVIHSPIFQTLGIEGIIGQDILNRYVQHWRFGPPGPMGAPEVGSLHLVPLKTGSVNRNIGSWRRTG